MLTVAALMMQTLATIPVCGKVDLLKPPLQMSIMNEVRMIGLDLAKNVFQVHAVDDTGAVVFRKQLRRGQVLKFFGGPPRCLVAMEACGSAHFWAREIGRLGHEVRMIPPA